MARPVTDDQQPAALGAPLLGQTLDARYRLIGCLGSGAMGDVYLAEHVALGKKIAVKVLKHHLTGNDNHARRFEQEAIAASRIGHQNIIDVTDFGRTPDGALYFVMEALDGDSLRALVERDGPVPLARALPILAQVCRALDAAHAHGIIHRDLKADNVMIVAGDDGADLVKVLDFGISKVTTINDAEEQRRMTQQGAVLGTPDYMSPEQIRGDPIDLRADVYAFGILAYELTTGSVPFSAPNVTGVMMMHLGEVPQPPSARRPELGLPPAFDALVLRALAKDKQQRFQSMNEVRAALPNCFEAIGLVPELTPPRRMVPQSWSAASARPAPMATPLPPKLIESRLADTHHSLNGTAAAQAAVHATRKRRPIAIALAAVVLASAGVAVAWVGRGSGAPASEPNPLLQAPPPIALPPPPVEAPAPAPVPVTTDTVAPTPLAPPPKPVPTIAQKLTGKDVAAVFARSQLRLRKCLQDHRPLLPAASGRLELSFTIIDSGEVKDVAVSSPLDAVITACLISRIKEIRFPRTRTPAVRFDLPLDYAFKN